MTLPKIIATTRGHPGDDGRELKFRLDREPTGVEVAEIVRLINDGGSYAERCLRVARLFDNATEVVAVAWPEVAGSIAYSGVKAAKEQLAELEKTHQMSASRTDAAPCEPMHAGEDGWTEWIRPAEGYRMQCCDCGLVHIAEFAIVTDSVNLPDGTFDAKRVQDEKLDVIFRMRREATDAPKRRYPGCPVTEPGAKCETCEASCEEPWNVYPKKHAMSVSRGQSMCDCSAETCKVEQNAYCRRTGAFNPPLRAQGASGEKP